MSRPSDPSSSRKRPGLHRNAVLAAAVALADREGIEALSMRSLAEALGVKAMSLYNHVSNKEDLLDGMVEIVVSEISLPKPNHDWRAEMRKRILSAHSMLLDHPWATGLIVSRANVGPVMLRYVDATIGCLRAAGFSVPAADHAWNAIDSYLYGFTLQKLNFPFAPEEYAEVAASFLDRIPAEEYPHLREMTIEVIGRRHDGLHSIEFGLDLLLDGLDRLRDQ